MIGRMLFALRPLGFVAALGLAALAIPAPAQQSASISGTWDMFWQTPQGPRQRGYMVFRQDGSALQAEFHGQRGQVSATGTVNGDRFSISGSRMLVSYRLDGRWQGDRLEGSFRALSANRSFTAVRRR